jgi:hypothetical protein
MKTGVQVGPNDPCPCGSGKKYKKCCLSAVQARMMPPRPAQRNGERLVFHQTPAEVAAAREQAATPLPQPQFARLAGPSPSGGETIEATGGHPFWVISGEDLDRRPVPEHCPAEVPNAAIPGRWVNAIDLRVGDILFTRDGRRVPVTNVSARHVTTKVYNLQVEGLHNYAVGYSGILVHNSSGVPQPPTVPNLAGMSRADAHIAIRQAGYTYHGTSAGGYVRYRHPSGAEIQIRPNGEIIRLGPPVTPQGGGRPYHPRIDYQGNPIPTHSTGEFVPPLLGRSSP